MAESDTRSVQEIKRETEQTRAGLANTVEELRTSVAETASDIRHRISPGAIKAELSGYMRSRGEQLVEDLTDAARRNPMQAAVVGASLAYPLFRLVRSIPVPVLMVGAGLFFAGSKTGQSVTQQAGDMVADFSDDVGRRARDLRDQVGGSAATAKNFTSQTLHRVTDAVSSGADQVSRAAEAAGSTLISGSDALQHRAASIGVLAGDRAGDFTNQSGRMAGSAADAVQDIAAGASSVARDAVTRTTDAGLNAARAVQDLASGASSVARDAIGRTTDAGLNAARTVQDLASSASSVARDAVSRTTDAGLDAARAVRDTASDLTDRAGKTMRETIEQNPLLVAGMGLLIGGLIASALPPSDMEKDLVGDASDAVKRRARAAASQGLDAARGAVGEIINETAKQAEAEGLTVDGLGKAAQEIGKRARRVAESAVTTAFDPAQNDHQPNAHGDNDHG